MRALSLTLLLLVGCKTEGPQAWSKETIPAELRPATSAAEAAMDEIQKNMLSALTAKMAEGGPVAAVAACQSIAPALTASIAQARGVDLGRTSFRLRNVRNAPRPWAVAAVQAAAGKKAAAESIRYLDLGDRVGILRPIPVGAPCLACHGDAAKFSPELKATLAAAYPKDEAVGFQEGDLRGFFWAEVKKRP
jgi:hypothetical protein